MRIVKNVEYLQAKNCRLCIHVGLTAFIFGEGWKGKATRVEIFTPLHRFRFSPAKASTV